MKRSALAAAVILGSCSSTGSDYQQYYQVLRQSFSWHDSGVTLQQAASIPYATMGWRLNDGRQNIIILATDGNYQIWTSAQHIVLQTERGLVTRTVGLPHDVAALAPRQEQALKVPAMALRGPYLDGRQADFPDVGAYGVAVTCRGQKKGMQTVKILGKAIATARVEETCDSTNLHWSFTNIYWVDPDSGMVWKSLQHIHPDGDVLETEIFRPPG